MEQNMFCFWECFIVNVVKIESFLCFLPIIIDLVELRVDKEEKTILWAKLAMEQDMFCFWECFIVNVTKIEYFLCFFARYHWFCRIESR